MSQAELEEAQLLLRKAREDADAATKLAADGDTADAIVGFHAQQAVEKALKAVQFRYGETIDDPLDREAAVALANQAIDWAEAQVAKTSTG